MVHVTVFMARLVHIRQNRAKYRTLKVQKASVMHRNRAMLPAFVSQDSAGGRRTRKRPMRSGIWNGRPQLQVK
jgi:hypothetical protein